MLHKNLVGKLLKAGATIEETSRGKDVVWYAATYNERLVVWYTEEGRARSVHSPSPHTDILTDCFCDTWHYTINSALYHLIGYEAWQKKQAEKNKNNTEI
jgi:hypothetical protein